MDSTPFYLSYAALWVLIILHSLVLLGVVRIVYQLQQNGAISHDAGMSAGQEAPEFSAVDLKGVPVNSSDFFGHLTALLFVSPDCASCKSILEDDMGYLNYKAGNNVILICRAGQQACRELAEQYELKLPVIVDEDHQLSDLYRIAGVPMAVLINSDGRIQSYGQPHRQELAEAFQQEESRVTVQEVA